MNPTTFKVEVSDSVLGQQIRNAMSINVIERVFLFTLKAVGLLDQAAPDRWANGEALAEPKSSKGKTFYEIVQNHAEGEKRMTFELSEKTASLANRSEITNIRFLADMGASLHLQSVT